jgi:hypothetical protein
MARMEEDVVFSNLRDKLFTAVVGDVLDKMGDGGVNSCRRPSGR